LLDQSLKQTLPHLYSAVAVRARKRTVFDAITDGSWISDIRGALSVQVLIEYIHLWELLSDVELQPEVEDLHIWKFTASGFYSTKSAYEALFIGATQFDPWREFGKAGLRGNVSSFCGLLPIIDAGQQTDLLKKALTIHQNVHFVIKLKKQ